MRALVTGATGFVGRVLVAELLRRGHSVRAAVRFDVSSPRRRPGSNSQSGELGPGLCRDDDGNAFPDGIEVIAVGELSAATDWRAALRDVDTVFHLAARVHVRGDAHDDWERVNVAATAALARAAIEAGARRFVFASSVKVMGETSGSSPFVEADPPDPQDAYGRSKLAAEQALAQLAGALEVTIVRAPLVYGPGVRANFLSLLRLADSAWPLPLARATARRSLVFVDNLADALIACATMPHPSPATYFVSDANDLSVAELVTQFRTALGARARLWPFPAALAGTLAGAIGRRDVAQRLFAPLQIDSERIRRELGWSPPFDQREALASTAQWFSTVRRRVA